MNNSDLTVNNLKPWEPGRSGNPKGRPKGGRNIKALIKELLLDETLYEKITNKPPKGCSVPIEAIVMALVIKAVDGDVRAADVLLKQVVDRGQSTDHSQGYFSKDQLVVRVVSTNGAPLKRHYKIDEQSGQMKSVI